MSNDGSSMSKGRGQIIKMPCDNFGGNLEPNLTGPSLQRSDAVISPDFHQVCSATRIQKPSKIHCSGMQLEMQPGVASGVEFKPPSLARAIAYGECGL